MCQSWYICKAQDKQTSEVLGEGWEEKKEDIQRNGRLKLYLYWYQSTKIIFFQIQWMNGKRGREEITSIKSIFTILKEVWHKNLSCSSSPFLLLSNIGWREGFHLRTWKTLMVKDILVEIEFYSSPRLQFILTHQPLVISCLRFPLLYTKIDWTASFLSPALWRGKDNRYRRQNSLFVSHLPSLFPSNSSKIWDLPLFVMTTNFARITRGSSHSCKHCVVGVCC